MPPLTAGFGYEHFLGLMLRIAERIQTARLHRCRAMASLDLRWEHIASSTEARRGTRSLSDIYAKRTGWQLFELRHLGREPTLSYHASVWTTVLKLKKN